jgi:hypothetical protein
MGLLTKTQTKIAGVVGGFGLLALVGYADYITGIQISLLAFYLLPIFFRCGMWARGLPF